MFRVSTTEERSCTVLTIDGRLSGDDLEVVEECCGQAISTGKAVQVLLRDVTMVDQAGRALLCRLAAKGVRLRGSGLYTSYLVKALDQPGTAPFGAGTAGGDRTKRKP